MVIDIVRCGCGYVLWGEDKDGLLLDADLHIRSAHPDLVGTLSPLELARPSEDGERAA